MLDLWNIQRPMITSASPTNNTTCNLLGTLETFCTDIITVEATGCSLFSLFATGFCWCQHPVLVRTLLSIILWFLECLPAFKVTVVVTVAAVGDCSFASLVVTFAIICFSAVKTTVPFSRNFDRERVVLGASGRFFRRSITSKNSGNRGSIPSSLSSSARKPVKKTR